MSKKNFPDWLSRTRKTIEDEEKNKQKAIYKIAQQEAKEKKKRSDTEQRNAKIESELYERWKALELSELIEDVFKIIHGLIETGSSHYVNGPHLKDLSRWSKKRAYGLNPTKGFALEGGIYYDIEEGANNDDAGVTYVTVRYPMFFLLLSESDLFIDNKERYSLSQLPSPEKARAAIDKYLAKIARHT